jgi:hypothetical protein
MSSTVLMEPTGNLTASYISGDSAGIDAMAYPHTWAAATLLEAHVGRAHCGCQRILEPRGTLYADLTSDLA